MRTSLVASALIGLFSVCTEAQIPPSLLQTPPPLVPARIIHRVKAVYPPIAKAAHVTGDVVVKVEINEAGNVTKCTIISGPEMFRSAAIDAAKQWTFTPGENNAAPNMHYSIVIRFHNLNSDTSD